MLLLAALVAGLAYWWLRPRPQVTATLHLGARPQAIAFESPAETPADFQTYQRTQAAMLKSRLVLNAALRQPKVAGLGVLTEQADPPAWLEKQLRVDFNASPEIMTVSLEGHQPEQLKILLDAIIDAYLEEVVNRERIGTQKLVEQLKELAKRYEDRIKANRRTVRSLQEQMGAGDNPALAMRQQMAQALYSQAVQDLARIRSEVREAYVRLSVLQSEDGAAASPTAAEVEDAVEQDSLLRKLMEREAQAEEAIEEIRAGGAQGDKDPQLQKPLREQQRLRQSIERRRTELRPRVEGRLRERAKAKASRQRDQLRNRLKILEELEKQLAAEVARLNRESKGLVKGHVDLTEINQDISHLEEMVKALKTRAERHTIELEAPPRVYRLQEAVIRRD